MPNAPVRSARVFLDYRGAVKVEKQEFALHILILDSGCEADQLPDFLVTLRLAGGHAETLAIPRFQQVGKTLEMKFARVGNVRKDSEAVLVAVRTVAE